MIPDDHDAVPMHDGRLPSPNCMRICLSPRSFCHSSCRPCRNVQAARLEPRVNALAVHDRRARCPRAVILVRSFVRPFFASRSFPGDLAGAPVQSDHVESMDVARLNQAARPMVGGTAHSDWDGTQDKDPIAPNDGGGEAPAGSRPSTGCSWSHSIRSEGLRASRRLLRLVPSIEARTDLRMGSLCRTRFPATSKQRSPDSAWPD